MPGEVGSGQVITDEILGQLGLDVGDLTPPQKVALSRELAASFFDFGVRVEAMLMAGFASIVATEDLTGQRVNYMLHEIGEETRHSRTFMRVVAGLQPKATSPLERLPRFVDRLARGLLLFGIASTPVTFMTAVLSGEEIADLLQKRISESPGSDPFIRDVSRYHRAEEARHVSFARAVLPGMWADSNRLDRLFTRHVAAMTSALMFELFFPPDAYGAAGLPRFDTWRKVRRDARRRGLRADALRPVLGALLDAGIVEPEHVRFGWRRVCQVDGGGRPLRPGPRA